MVVAVGLDGDDLRAVHQAVDDRDDAGGVWTRLRPLCEGLVRGEDDGPILLVASRYALEEQVGVPGVGREVADFVDAEERGL